MLFEMNRNFTVKGFGHSLKFVKGVAMHVPPVLYTEVRKYGAVAIDGDVEDTSTNNIAEPKKTKSNEPQGPDRAEVLLIAIQALVTENDSNKFGGNGAPSVQAMTDNLGFRVTADERTAAWNKFNQLLEAENEPSNISQPVADQDNDTNA